DVIVVPPEQRSQFPLSGRIAGDNEEFRQRRTRLFLSNQPPTRRDTPSPTTPYDFITLFIDPVDKQGRPASSSVVRVFVVFHSRRRRTAWSMA
ncbi:MAG: hypothetical protein LBH76_08885, partial [Propionibacteriaceae bacterium]|nr:hypothetical protein [Propionibacteriaceae bacterium]